MRNWKQLAVGVSTSIVAFGAATGLAWRLEQVRPTKHSTGAYDLLYLPTVDQAKFLSLGFRAVMADWYWVKALQYFTDSEQARNEYRNLGDYLDLVVGLDPDYEFAYKFAGVSLPYDSGRLHFVNTRRSTSFLERGAERFPGNWQFHFLLGYNYLNFHDQPEKAAEHFSKAALLPGAPRYLGPFAARVFAVAGKVDRALLFAKSAVETTTDPETRAMFEARVRDLEREQVLQGIELAAQRFKEVNGRLPRSLEELESSGFPHPGPGFTLDENGVAHSADGGERLRLYEDDTTGMRGE
ncbi:MAG: hypothetical protein ACOZQL_33125 [Myxococcota bacterium]